MLGTGRLTDRETGKPVAGEVFSVPLYGNDWPDRHPGFEGDFRAPWERLGNAATDVEGHYRLTVLPGAALIEGLVIVGGVAAENDENGWLVKYSVTARAGAAPAATPAAARNKLRIEIIVHSPKG